MERKRRISIWCPSSLSAWLGVSVRVDLNSTVADNSGVKFALFSYCYAIKGASSQVQVLWEDHRNDLFTYASRIDSIFEANVQAMPSVSLLLLEEARSLGG